MEERAPPHGGYNDGAFGPGETESCTLSAGHGSGRDLTLAEPGRPDLNGLLVQRMLIRSWNLGVHGGWFQASTANQGGLGQDVGRNQRIDNRPGYGFDITEQLPALPDVQLVRQA
jgi:hypothetical protein